MDSLLSKIQFKHLAIISVILLVFALLYNLSYHVFIGDECIRSIVAFEMMHSGNYFVPTINSDFYYSKPPLYNWFIALSFYLFGEVSELAARFPTVIFTLLFGYVIYHINKLYFDKRFSFLLAMLFLTCGRILFWDSMLALIDIAYSMVVYIQIYMIYHLFNKGKVWQLFLITYFLTAIGYLLKGYPSLAFQAISVGVWFTYKGAFKKLFSIKHISGIVLLVSIVAGYYWIYAQYNDVQKTVAPLLDQATRRTIVDFGFVDVIIHFFNYPIENIYHFLPWSLFSILLFRKDVITKIKVHPFVEFNAIMFMANIIIYWLSPEVYPRYILMLVPLFFNVLLYFYFYQNDKKLHKQIMYIAFKTLVVLLPIAMLAMWFIPSSQEVSYANLKIIIMFLVMGVLAYLYFKRRDLRVITFVLMTIVTRIGFDIFILHDRKYYDEKTILKCEAQHIGTRFKNDNLYIYKNAAMFFIDSYYIASSRGKPLKRERNNFDANSYYITDTIQYDMTKFEKIDSFTSWQYSRSMFVVKLKNPTEHNE